MKPIYLKLSAFGPFAEEVEIPFHKLGGEGLVLISGDTGAGKTTIFDGLCFALFGETSGSNRGVDSVRSDFSKNEKKTMAELIFSHKQKEYRIERNPAYQRLKKNGQGMTMEVADANLYCEEILISSGYQQVKKVIEDLLGIDVRQFKQIAMIAQGEFLKLLYADSLERSGIFRKVFHTDIYAHFQTKLKEKEKESRIQFEDSTKRLIEHLKQMIDDDDFVNLQYRADKIIENASQRLELLQNEIDQFKQQERRLSDKISVLSQKIIRLEEQEKTKNSIVEIQSELLEMEGQKQAYIEEKERLESARISLEQAYPLEQDVQKVKHDLQEQAALLSEQEEALEEVKKILIQHTVFKENLMAEQKKFELEREEFFRIKQLWPLFEKEEALREDIGKLERDKASQEDALRILSENTDEKKQVLQVLQGRLDERRNMEREHILLQASFMELESKEKRFVKAKMLVKELLSLDEEVQIMRKDYLEREAAWKIMNQSAEEAERAFFREQAGILAQRLTDGQACPVCGSAEHPNRAIASKHAPTEAQVNKKRQMSEEARKHLSQLAENGKALRERRIILSETLAAEKEELQLNDQDFEQEFFKLQQMAANRKEALEALAREIESLECMEKSISENQMELGILETNKSSHEGLLSGINQDIQRLTGERRSFEKQLNHQSREQVAKRAQELESQINDYIRRTEVFAEKEQRDRTEKAQLEALASEGKKREKQLKQKYQLALDQFEKRFAELGFKDFADYQSSLPENRSILEADEQNNQSYFQKMQQLEESLQVLRRNAKDCINENMSRLCGEKAQQEEEISKISNEIEKRKSHCFLHETTLKQAKKELILYQKMMDMYLPISELSQTANGELKGQEKVAFETFVQGFYFDQVLIAANLRLKKMTEGRYTLIRAQNAGNKRSQSGLELEVMDFYTGKVRTVKSLSGGEAFKSSLSLALGLSDVIQNYAGGIEIDTMFIDEGFGSLDETSRGQAIQVLQELSYGNRLVGIISHITELKDNIEKKIIVSKTTSGSSVKIVV